MLSFITYNMSIDCSLFGLWCLIGALVVWQSFKQAASTYYYLLQNLGCPTSTSLQIDAGEAARELFNLIRSNSVLTTSAFFASVEVAIETYIWKCGHLCSFFFCCHRDSWWRRGSHGIWKGYVNKVEPVIKTKVMLCMKELSR